MAGPWEDFKSERPPWEDFVSVADTIPIDRSIKAPPSVRPPPVVDPSIWDRVVGFAQAGRNVLGNVLASPVLAPIAVAGELTGNKDWGGRASAALVNEPTSALGREYVANVGQKLAEYGPAAVALQGMIPKGSATTAWRAINDADNGAVSRGPSQRQIDLWRQRTPELEGIIKAREMGLTVPPSHTMGGRLENVIEGIAGGPMTQQLASQKNAEKIRSIVKRDINNNKIGVGIAEDAPLTRDAVAGVIKDAGKKYEPVKKAGEIIVDDKFFSDLDSATSRYSTAAESFTHRSENPFQRVYEGLFGGRAEDGSLVKRRSFNAASAIEEVKLLRDDAVKAYANNEPGLGRTYRAFADALDNAIDRNLSRDPASKNIVADYREARRVIAKAWDAYDAINPATGSANPSVFARKISNDKPISGEMRDLGMLSSQFSKSTKSPEGLETPGAPHIFDVLPGAVSPTSFGWLGVRPAARHMLLSDPVQSFMAKRAEKLLGAINEVEKPPVIPPEVLKSQINRNWLGDLVPDWTTSPGAGGPRRTGIDPIGLVRSVDETPPLPQGMPERPGSRIPVFEPKAVANVIDEWTTIPGAGGEQGLFGSIEPVGLLRALGDERVGASRLKGRPQMPVAEGLPGLADVAIAGKGGTWQFGKPWVDAEVKVGPEQSRLAAAPMSPGGIELSRLVNMPKSSQRTKLLNDFKRRYPEAANYIDSLD